jgi:hypothetical protein
MRDRLICDMSPNHEQRLDRCNSDLVRAPFGNDGILKLFQLSIGPSYEIKAERPIPVLKPPIGNQMVYVPNEGGSLYGVSVSCFHLDDDVQIL